jgi:hypothetical protein
MGAVRWEELLALAPQMGYAARAFLVAFVEAFVDIVLAALMREVAVLPVDIDMVYVVAAALPVVDLENYQGLIYLADQGSTIPGMGRCDELVVLVPHRYSYLASRILLYYYASFIDEYIITRSISIHIWIRKCYYDLKTNRIFYKRRKILREHNKRKSVQQAINSFTTG